MFAGMTYYELIWFFLLYSILGWVVEVVYHVIAQGKVVNRGFLNGPVCPIYGFGMIAVLILVYAVTPPGEEKPNVLLLFAGGMLLTSAIELFGGWALDRLFHMRWWDYSDLPFNFHGYICLKFSILWGLGVLLVVGFVHPPVKLVPDFLIPVSAAGWVLLALLYTVYLADLIVTYLTVRDMAKDYEELERFRKSLRALSDSMTEHIGAETIRAGRRIGEQQVQAALARAELKDALEEKRAEYGRTASLQKAEFDAKVAELREKREAAELRFAEMLDAHAARLRSSVHFGRGRLLKAFPDLRSYTHDEILKELKKRLEG